MKYIKLDKLEVIESTNNYGEQVIEIRRILSNEQLQLYFDALYNRKCSAEDIPQVFERTIGQFIFSQGNEIQLTRNVARELVSQLKAA